MVIVNSFRRLFNPVSINYDGMIVFALIGVIVNFLAAFFTRNGNSINQKSVNLHMLEDVLGWIVVLVGAIVMRFTDVRIIDPIISILVAVFILISSFKNFKSIIDLFLERVPKGISIDEVRNILLGIDGVIDIHHIHVWSIDGYNNYATMHVVAKDDFNKVKKDIRSKLRECDIVHVTIEIEDCATKCCDVDCHIVSGDSHHHHHHH